MSVKCLILSGIPHSLPILDLEYALKKLFHQDAIEKFCIADFASETKTSSTKKVTIHFDSSTDAMLAHNIVDGYEYRLPSGKQCKILASLAKANSLLRSPSPETSYRRRHRKDYERTDVVPSGYYKRDDMYSSISKKLDSQIEVLMKQKKLLELERQVMKQKKRLKAEMEKSDVSDSDDEQNKRKRPKSSTPPGLQVNWHRVRLTSRSRSRSRERRRIISRSRERYIRLRSRERRRTRSRSRERRRTRSRSKERRRSRSRSRERRHSRSPLKKQRSIEEKSNSSLSSKALEEKIKR